MTQEQPCHGKPKRNRNAILLLLTFALALLAWAQFATPGRQLLYNPSDSVPPGWYYTSPATNLQAGSLVLVTLPKQAALLAAQRGYLPAHIPLLKRIAATHPQTVCVRNNSVAIDGTVVATVLQQDNQGRPLPAWRHCRRLQPGELFLLSNTHPGSFDSRYFGPVTTTEVIARAHPLRRVNPP